MGMLGASDAALGLRDLLTNELTLALVMGERIGRTGQHLPAGAGIGGHVLSTGQPYVADNIIADSHYYPMTALNDARAVACVPLITTTQVLGVMWAERLGRFSEVEVRVFSAIAGIAANALQRAALHEQTKAQLQRLGALREIDSAIMSSMDLGTTLSILLGHTMDQLGVDAGDILLLRPGMSVLEFSTGRGFRARTSERSRLRLGEGHAGQAVLERRLVTVPDLRSNPDPSKRAELLAGEMFVAQFCVPLVAKGQVVGVLEVFHRAPLDPDADWLSFLGALGGQAAIAVTDAWLFSDLQRSNTELLSAYDTTLEGWSAALDLRDKETEGHSQRVMEKTLQLAQAVGVSEGELEQMRRGALLHDIGKMGIPDAILLKPGQLTDDEWGLMRQHPRYAYELLSPIAYLRPALDIPYCHHERWDGSGYPRQLKGEAIPLAARIFAVVDVWDALRSDRPYRAGWPDDQVLAYLRDQAGQHFDPRIVTAFLALGPSESLALGTRQ
jgi:HD-GYP domain-containing protein (c-di-GMP phosphodiesterase class II)